MGFKMLFAICYNLDQSEILSSGNGLSGEKSKKECPYEMHKGGLYPLYNQVMLW